MPYEKPNNEAASANANLTNRGFKQMVNLGLLMKEKYAQQLDLEKYNPDQVKIVPSSRERCVFSAKAYMHGFFGNEGKGLHESYIERHRETQDKRFKKEVTDDLEKFEMKLIELRKNYLFRSHSPMVCPRMKTLIKKKNFEKDDLLVKYVDMIFAKLKNDGMDLTKHINQGESKISQIKSLYDYLYSAYFSYNSTKKPPIRSRYFQMIKTAKTYMWYLARSFLKRIYHVQATPLLRAVRNDIIRGINDFKQGKQDRKKLVLYSGQDSVLFALLNVFQLTNSDCFKLALEELRPTTRWGYNCFEFPKFGDHLTFEVSHVGFSFSVAMYVGKKHIVTKKVESFVGYLKNLESKLYKKFCFGNDEEKMQELKDVEDTGVDLMEDLQHIIERTKEKSMKEALKKKRERQELERSSWFVIFGIGVSKKKVVMIFGFVGLLTFIGIKLLNLYSGNNDKKNK
jgi:hypothetical protein